MLGEQLRQVVFEDGHSAFAQAFYPGFVVVNADDMMAHFGETNRRNESHISGTDDADRNWLRHSLLLSP